MIPIKRYARTWAGPRSIVAYYSARGPPVIEHVYYKRRLSCSNTLKASVADRGEAGETHGQLIPFSPSRRMSRCAILLFSPLR